jgi:hypothetical protein
VSRQESLLASLLVSHLMSQQESPLVSQQESLLVSPLVSQQESPLVSQQESLLVSPLVSQQKSSLVSQQESLQVSQQDIHLVRQQESARGADPRRDCRYSVSVWILVISGRRSMCLAGSWN